MVRVTKAQIKEIRDGEDFASFSCVQEALTVPDDKGTTDSSDLLVLYGHHVTPAELFECLLGYDDTESAAFEIDVHDPSAILLTQADKAIAARDDDDADQADEGNEVGKAEAEADAKDKAVDEPACEASSHDASDPGADAAQPATEEPSHPAILCHSRGLIVLGPYTWMKKTPTAQIPKLDTLLRQGLVIETILMPGSGTEAFNFTLCQEGHAVHSLLEDAVVDPAMTSSEAVKVVLPKALAAWSNTEAMRILAKLQQQPAAKPGDELLLIGIGEYFLEKGEVDRAIDLFRAAEPLLDEDDESKLQRLWRGLGSALRLDHPDEALAYIGKLLNLLDEKEKPCEVATILNLIGGTLTRQGKMLEAVQPLQRSIELYRENGKPQRAISGLMNLGWAFQSEGRMDEAEKCLKEALLLLGKDEHSEASASVHITLGSLKRRQGHSEESLAHYDKAIKDFIHVFKTDIHVSIANVYDNIANVYRGMDKMEEAISWHLKALEIYTQCFGSEDHLDVALAFKNLGSSYHDVGRNAEAQPLLEKAVRIMSSLLKTNLHPDIAGAQVTLGLVHEDLKNTKVAYEILRQALATFEAFKRDPLSIASTHHHICRVLEAIPGMLPEAAKHAVAEAAVLVQCLGALGHPRVADAHERLADLLCKINPLDPAGVKAMARAVQVRLELRLPIEVLRRDLRKLVVMHEKMGDLDGAVDATTAFLKHILIPKLGEDHDLVFQEQERIVLFREKQGLYRQAKDACARLLEIAVKSEGQNGPRVIQLRRRLENLAAQI